jgi:predicted outer membrane repeat protein
VSNGDFTLNKQAINTIGVNGTAEFTVVPNTGLAEGTHNALVTVSGGSNIEEQSFEVSFVVTRSVPQTLADLVTRMAEDKSLASASYILPSGNETYTTAVTLTAANSPATVVIDGGGRVITGGTNSITVGAGITFTLKNIKFTTLPLTVAAGGKLILGNEGDAAGSAVVQSNAGAGITVNGGTLELKAGALVKDNHASGIVLENGSHFTMTGGEISGNEVNDGGSFYGYGGGVLMKGANSVFTMDGGVIKENKAVASSLTITFYLGGGVAIIDGGTFTMIGGSISENKAGHSGGGVYMEGDGGTFIMTGGSISENGMDSGGFGGGVYAEGDGVSFTLDGGVITGNKAAYGAGVWIGGEGTTFTMDSGAISGNNAIGGYGGGVRLNGGVSFTMNGGEISGNTTDGRGGGILMGGTTVLNMTGGDIKGNTAVLEGGGVRLGSTTELTGNPSIGAKDAGRGSIWGNTASTGPDVYDPSL